MAAVAVGGLLSSVLSFVAVMETVEGMYRAVPESRWWMLRVRIALATPLPVVACAGVAVAAVPAGQRRLALGLAGVLGGGVLALLFLNLLGVL